ncbi:MAG: translesion error-prone DNA polymerase V autoproteolytic subunit [Dysgonamonadaceae bacterium]|nr:translesion error-prone DNA polymerase V autoproteolytic subunit [Dysgonamonadaceae bacterium]MDD4728360.1 translesion error-prone DNA polymerase V autoproteolytic subunit [Dysgonamonadaceae bacterium]
MKSIYKSESLELFTPDISGLELPFVGGVVAGFPSPADDFVYESIDINKLIVKHPDATFYARVKGQSMVGDFMEGDLLVIDRSIEWTDNKIALCFVDNEFTLKRLKIEEGKCFLIPSNCDFPVIEVNDENEVIVWGIVTYSIKKH